MSAPGSPKSETIPGAVKLAVLTAAIGAGFAGPAHAGFISEDPTGATTTFSLSGPDTSQSFDLNGDGIADYTISVTSGSEIAIDGISGANQVVEASSVVDLAVASFASSSDFVSPGSLPPSLKLSTGSAILSDTTAPPSPASIKTNFTPGTPGYLELLFDSNGTQEYVGYIEGTVSEPASLVDTTFTVDDYGYNPVPVSVPEPGSLALLAAGVSGLIALRYRRRRRMHSA